MDLVSGSNEPMGLRRGSLKRRSMPFTQTRALLQKMMPCMAPYEASDVPDARSITGACS